MPELPDVETFRRYLDKTSLHQRISEVTVARKELLKGVSEQNLGSILTGHSLESTRRHGKHLLAEVDGSGAWLGLHFGMTGFLDYAEHSGEWPRHTRLALTFDSGCTLAYVDQRSIGSIRLVDDLEGFVRDEHLGLDALGIGHADFMEVLRRKRGAVKNVLMDQKSIAGIGNVYADEILFQARVHPSADIPSLDEDALSRLFQAMGEVLKQAIDAKAAQRRCQTPSFSAIGGEEPNAPAARGRLLRPR
jgi:formamidopyrimidine-DNA glycosylase